jgi:cyclophilin family peptidyl-prolyl cis-trans isomerase
MRRAMTICAVLLGLAGCGGSATHSTTTTHRTNPTAPAAATSTTQAAAPACHTVAVPKPKGPQHLHPPSFTLDPHKTYTVTIVTNCGTFAFELSVKQSPKTSSSFYALVKRGLFDGLVFHRVAAGFVIQGGDPLGTGAGGPGYTIVEAPPANTQYVRGTVAMAKTAAQPSGASGSQFFIVTAANAGLPPQYALAGHVVSGQNVVNAIGALPTNPPGDGMPTPAVVMSSVTVKTS